VRLHLVESMSGHLTSMLNARQLDLAVLFDTGVARRWSVMPLLEEKLYLMSPRTAGEPSLPASTRMAQLDGVPLILPPGHARSTAGRRLPGPTSNPGWWPKWTRCHADVPWRGAGLHGSTWATLGRCRPRPVPARTIVAVHRRRPVQPVGRRAVARHWPRAWCSSTTPALVAPALGRHRLAHRVCDDVPGLTARCSLSHPSCKR
jgi:hypothetical protein